MKKLPEQFKKDWVEALRSGKYVQVKEHLADVLYDDVSGEQTETIGYCCLGVAACVLGQYPDVYDKTALTAMDIPADINAVMIQPFADSHVENELIKLNDNLGKPFSEIADWIEENL